MRLFIAALPPPAAEEALQRAAAALRAQGVGRFCPPRDYHLTLAFLGELPDDGPVRAAMLTLDSPPPQLLLREAGQFGDLIWAGAAPDPSLMALQAQLSQRLRAAGLHLPERSFIPHITLCRRFVPRDRLNLDQVAAALNAPAQTIPEVHLMVSESGPPRYHVLHTQPL